MAQGAPASLTHTIKSWTEDTNFFVIFEIMHLRDNFVYQSKVLEIFFKQLKRQPENADIIKYRQLRVTTPPVRTQK